MFWGEDVTTMRVESDSMGTINVPRSTKIALTEPMMALPILDASGIWLRRSSPYLAKSSLQVVGRR